MIRLPPSSTLFPYTSSSDLNNRIYPGAVMNGMLVYMADNQAGGADAAIEFLQKHEDVWTKWVSSSVAAKVKASL